jgi:hypothetical protein
MVPLWAAYNVLLSGSGMQTLETNAACCMLRAMHLMSQAHVYEDTKIAAGNICFNSFGHK